MGQELLQGNYSLRRGQGRGVFNGSHDSDALHIAEQRAERQGSADNAGQEHH